MTASAQAWTVPAAASLMTAPHAVRTPQHQILCPVCLAEADRAMAEGLGAIMATLIEAQRPGLTQREEEIAAVCDGCGIAVWVPDGSM